LQEESTWPLKSLDEPLAARISGTLRASTKRPHLRETVEHPFGTMKARMGTTHFLCKTLPKVATEMAHLVLAYNLRAS
jgi:hypothetical protein